MSDHSITRLARLTGIQTLLQSKKLTTASELAKKYGISVRTIYRDIRALEESGLPVVTEEGKGYSIVDGYKLPPVMFTEKEAVAMITSEKIILQNKDSSLVSVYSDAISKIKAVLKSSNKYKADFLKERVHVGKNFESLRTSNALIDIQLALTNYQLIKVKYKTVDGRESERLLEPFYIYHSVQEDWTLHAYCRLRKEFRTFRLDRMASIQILDQQFEPHKVGVKKYFGKKIIVPIKNKE
jgi:predicted DNA-binding transcriptional regulator YafY